MKEFISRNLLPIFILRHIKNSELIGKYSDTAIHFKDLAPSDLLYRRKRDKEITFDEFKEEYLKEISGVNLSEMLKKLGSLILISNADGAIFLGYGSSVETCHRSILSELLNKSGLLGEEIKELIW